MSKLFIVAGHGGLNKSGRVDPGAVANGTTEAEVAEKIAKKLVIRLRDGGADAILVPTGLNLTKKIAWCNSNTNAGDYLVSIHLNAAGTPEATGAEGYYYNGSEMAEDICLQFLNTYVKNMPLKLRRVAGDTATRHGSLGIIRQTPPLALLIELGFITNKHDLDSIREGSVDALEKCCMELLGIDVPVRNISDWAKPAIDKAIKKKVAMFWDKPDQIVASNIVEHLFRNLGVIETVTGDGISKERMVVILDRLRKTKKGEKSLLD